METEIQRQILSVRIVGLLKAASVLFLTLFLMSSDRIRMPTE